MISKLEKLTLRMNAPQLIRRVPHKRNHMVKADEMDSNRTALREFELNIHRLTGDNNCSGLQPLLCNNNPFRLNSMGKMNSF